MRNSLVMLGSLALLGACGPGQTDSFDTGDSDDGFYMIDADRADTNIGMTGVDGERMNNRTGPDVEVDLPAGFAIFPGARIVSSTQMDADGETSRLVLMTTTAGASEVTEFYSGQARAAGVPVQDEMNFNGTRIITGSAVDGPSFQVSASPTGSGETSINLLVGG